MNVSPAIRRLLAAAIVAQPLLVGVNALFHPPIEFNAAGILDATTKDPTTWYVVHVVAALGALLVLPAALGLRTLVSDRGARLANIGVGAGIFSGLTLGIAFVLEGSILRLAATSGIDRASALALTEAFMAAPEFIAFPIGVMTFTLAGAMLAAALLVARTVPRWQAGLYLFGTLAAAAGVPGSPLGPVAFGIVTVAAAFLAGHVIRGGAGRPTRTAEAVRAQPAG